jgi:Protein of unknown function (DUF3040)
VNSDRDIETLGEIQFQLQVGDPTFARSFDAEAWLPRPLAPDRTRMLYTALFIFSCATLALAVLTAGSIVNVLGVAVVAALAYEARRRHDFPTNQQRL